MYKLNAYGKDWDLTLVRSQYSYGKGLAVIANTSEGKCFAILTVNLESFDLDGDKEYAFVDTNNCPWVEEFLVKNEIAYFTGINVPQGFCTYPLYKFDLTKLQEEL